MDEALFPEDVWREMRLHMEWNEGLSLCFLFSDDASSIAPILQWAKDAWQWRTSPMLKLEPADAVSASQEVLQGMQDQLTRLHMTRAPVWVQMLTRDVHGALVWDQARATLLSRLNESREWLVRDFARPLVICLPSRWQHRVVQVAPDLWHVRSYTALIHQQPGRLVVFDAKDMRHSNVLNCSEAALKPLYVAVAAARQRLLQQPLSANLQRELSSALLDLSEKMLENGRSADALAACRESLEIFRQLRQALGDSPQVLRDLSISLNKVGQAEVASGRSADALDAFRESLEICRQLRQALGDSPQVLRDLSISLDQVGQAEDAAGRSADALDAYRESLEIFRQLRQALGDSPQVLDDVAASLERLAHSPLVDRPARQSAMQEAVALRQRLVAATYSSDYHAARLARTHRLSAQLNSDPSIDISNE